MQAHFQAAPTPAPTEEPVLGSLKRRSGEVLRGRGELLARLDLYLRGQAVPPVHVREAQGQGLPGAGGPAQGWHLPRL